MNRRIRWITALYNGHVRYVTPILARTDWGAKRIARRRLTENERRWPGTHTFAVLVWCLA